MAARLALLLFCAIAGAAGFKKVCYYEAATGSRPDSAIMRPEDINAKLCTHIVYCFATVTRDGKILVPAVPDPLRKTFLISQLIKTLKAKNPEVKVLLGVKANKPEFSAVVREARKDFIRHVVDFLRKNKFDGVDFYTHDTELGGDLKIMKDLTWHLRLWMKLKRMMKDKIITATYHPDTLLGNLAMSGIVVNMIKELDWINLATYDLRAPNLKTLVHHTSLKLINEIISKLASVLKNKESSFQKLTFGFATYGRTYKLVSPDLHWISNASAGLGEPGKLTEQKGLMATFEMCSLISGARISKSREGSVPYMYDKKTWISYDDNQSMRKKLHLCQKMKFGGISVRSLDLDDTKGVCNYTKTVPVDKHLMTIAALTAASNEFAVTNTTRPSPTQRAKYHSRTETIRPTTESKGRAKHERVRVCYYNVKALQRKGLGFFSPKMLDPSLCTHIIYGLAFVTEKNKWTIDSQKNVVKELKELKKSNPELKVLLSVTGEIDRILASKQISTDIINKLVKVVKENDLDGIDLYMKILEIPNMPDKTHVLQSITALLQRLRHQLTAQVKRETLLVTTISGKYDLTNVIGDLKKLMAAVDWINFAAFDFMTYKDGKTGYSAPINEIQLRVESLVSKGLPADKLVMGIASYGRTFKLAHENMTKPGSPVVGPGRPGNITNKAGMLAFYELCKRGYTVVRDEVAMVPYGFVKDEWVSFEDLHSLERKVDFAMESDLKGIFLWTVDLDDFSNQCGNGKSPFLNLIKTRMEVHRFRKTVVAGILPKRGDEVREKVPECRATGLWSLLPFSDFICNVLCDKGECYTTYCNCL